MITSKSLRRFVAFILMLLAPIPAIAAARHDVVLMVASRAVAQGSRASSARRESEQLLSQARAAIKRGDLQAAESLIGKAEELQVPYNVFHLGLTPRKLRADIIELYAGGPSLLARRIHRQPK